MNLDTFLAHYNTTDVLAKGSLPLALQKKMDKDFLFCLGEIGGKTFNNGLYRLYSADYILNASEIVWRVFPVVYQKAFIFAADWSGRQFGIDFTEIIDGKPTVGCFDLGCPDSFSTDQPIVPFHNKVLIEQNDAALALNFYKKWFEKCGQNIPSTHCVGYKVPLFLGGADCLDNLELTDMEVYLEICAQLWSQAKKLPQGTSIKDVLIKQQ